MTTCKSLVTTQVCHQSKTAVKTFSMLNSYISDTCRNSKRGCSIRHHDPVLVSCIETPVVMFKLHPVAFVLVLSACAVVCGTYIGSSVLNTQQLHECVRHTMLQRVAMRLLWAGIVVVGHLL